MPTCPQCSHTFKSIKPAPTDEQLLERLAISRQDLQHCIDYLKALPKLIFGVKLTSRLRTLRAFDALLSCAVINYAKPFTSNELNPVKVASKIETQMLNVSSPLSAREQWLHDYFLRLRNKALAHSESTYNPTSRRPSGLRVSREFSILYHWPNVEGTLILPGDYKRRKEESIALAEKRLKQIMTAYFDLDMKLHPKSRPSFFTEKG